MLIKLRKHTIFSQILIAGISPAIVIFISLFTYSLISRLNDASANQREIAIRIAENIAASSELAIISGNDTQLIEIMRSAINKDITAITVVNLLTKNKVYLKSNHRSHQSFELITVPVFQSRVDISDSFTGDIDTSIKSPKEIGTVTIEQSKDQLEKLQKRIVIVSSSIGALSIFLCILLAWLISRRISKPLAEINTFTKNISLGNLGSRLKVKGEGELGELQNHINEMTMNLEAQQAELTSRLQQLQLAKTLADEANNAKSLFLATMTHELRTPMNGALGMLQLLSTTELNQEQSNYIEIAKSSSEHLLNIVNNILDFSKIEKGDLKLDSHLYSPTTLFDMHLTPLIYEAKNKGVELNYSVSSKLRSVNVYGDDTRVRQIVLNLASNAVKFTHSGNIDIRLDSEEINAKELLLTLSVKDTGIGIDESDQLIVFDSFRQADGSRKRRYGGSGLGLAIVKRLCSLMHAELKMDSKLGEGTQFTIKWKCRYEAVQAIDETTPQENVLAGKTVLIVEDNPVNQMLVANTVKRWNMIAITANNGQECLIELQKQHVDIVLMDLQMPTMDGYEASIKIRQHAKYAAIPIIALTANSIQEDKDRCFSVGMNDFLSKPVSLNVLKEKISYWLSS
ncbi:response regulator [Zhongshania aquimaris]|uniref:histidine kinase n=1 Tax=Zhongshania aquimaris TaxID=2857107 RepID=A0ABS6VRW9_9GAMM|nr:response regulator [Zhongshania aquimaris]MBW2941042.1 response regulator [Zhongshania aquimaris]